MAKTTHENEQSEYCQASGRPYIVGKNPDSQMAVVFRPSCGRWSCPVCSVENAKVWVLDAWRGTTVLMEQGNPMRFITLTSRGGVGRTRDRSLDAFKAGWPKLSRRVKYEYGSIEYIMIPEQHKNGVVHVHMLATCDLSQRWWKDNAYAVGLGYMSKVKPVVDAGKAAFYVSKYIGKEFVAVEWPKGFRRVRASRGWPKLPKIERPDDWNYETFLNVGALYWEIHYLRDAGYEVKVSESAGLDVE